MTRRARQMSLPLPGDQMELGFDRAASLAVAVAATRERHRSAVRWLLGVMRSGVPADGDWLVQAAARRGITAAEAHAAFEALFESGAIEKSIEPVSVGGARAYMPVLRLVPFRRRNYSSICVVYDRHRKTPAGDWWRVATFRTEEAARKFLVEQGNANLFVECGRATAADLRRARD